MIQVEKKVMVEELKQKIDSWNKYSETTYGYSVEDAKEFLKRFRIGIYDSSIKGMFWFGPRVDVDLLVCWDADRRSSKKTLSNITEENLIVYAALLSIKEHITKIELYPKIYEVYNKTFLGKDQTPMSELEKETFKNIYTKVLNTNYNWREAREIQKKFKQLNIYNNEKFPHNLEEISACFFPTVKPIFPNFFEKGKCYFDTLEVVKTATEITENLTQEKLKALFRKEPTSPTEEYICRMILSQFNYKKLLSDTSINEKAIIKQDLSLSTRLSEGSIEILFAEAKINDLLYLTKGTLLSLIVSQKVFRIKDMCQELEAALKSRNSSKLYLSNGKLITPLPENKHEKKFIRFQKKYEYLYKNATDLEYVEGCIEILGDMLIAQMYDYANIEISKCLFNSLLISRGILPPVIDFNEDNQNLLKEFIKSKDIYYAPATSKLLEETIIQTKQFNERHYLKPVII